MRKIRGTICETVSRKLQMIDLFEYSKPGRYGPATEGPLEGVAEDTARWRGAARHDDVAEARGRRPPSKKT